MGILLFVPVYPFPDIGSLLYSHEHLFLNDVIFFVSEDENLSKSRVKYLESRLVQLAKVANRYKIENSNNSHASSLPLSDRDVMEEFLSHIKILLGVFNHLILAPSAAAAVIVGYNINGL